MKIQLNKLMEVTVLMAVYNGGQYLRQSVESVLKQNYSDFEFLIVDDKSSDESLEIIKDYQNPRIRIIQNPVNKGQTVSLNIGLRAARGKYIARIDADDIAFPHWLQSQVNFLKNNGDIDVLSGGIVTFGRKGTYKMYLSPSCREDILLKAVIKSPINHGSSLMKKIAILNIGGYNDKYKFAADYDLWTSLLRRNGRIASNSDIVMAIRCHADSESEKNKLTGALKEFSEISRQHIKFITGMDLTSEESLLMCRAHYDEGGLNRKDFLNAVEIHKNVYASLKHDFNLDKAKVEFWYKKQAKTFFLRRIYWYILNPNRLEIRAVIKEFLKRLGFNAVFSGLYFFSFFPQCFLDFVVKAYCYIHLLLVRLFLLNKKTLKLKYFII